MKTKKITPVYSVIDPNKKEDMLALLRKIAVEKLLHMETNHSQ